MIDPKTVRFLPDVSAETRPWESFATKRADALVQLAESYLADEPKGSSGADRYQVVVHVSAETLKAEMAEVDVSAETPKSEAPGADVSAETPSSEARGMDVSAETRDPFRTDFAYLEDGPHVSAETARRLSCDAALIAVTDDAQGEPSSIGRKGRLVPSALRRAQARISPTAGGSASSRAPS